MIRFGAPHPARPAAACLALLAAACTAEPERRQPAAVTEAAPYLATLADDHEAWPQALIRGTFRMVDGCAMLDENLLVLPRGARLEKGARGETVIRLAGASPRVIPTGYTLSGGGGGYPASSMRGEANGWRLAEPMPERCARLATQAVLVAPDLIVPPSRYRDCLYTAIQREDLQPRPIAPVSGTLRIVDQCLLLDDALLVLPARSYVEFDRGGTPVIHVATSYMETVATSPGDRIEGSGGGLMAEAEPIHAAPRPLIQPVPERCRPPGRRGVMLNPNPRVIRAGDPGYRDPGAAGTYAVPPPAPPPPVSDPTECPPGSRLFHGLCRDAEGKTVPARKPSQ